MEKALALFEHKIFGVCSFWGDFWGISSAKIRLFFVYASFMTKGSPILLYMAFAFIINLKKYWRIRQSRVLDL